MLILWILQYLILSSWSSAEPLSCYRTSKYLVPKTPGDNGFRITVEGSYKTYVPGRTYKGEYQEGTLSTKCFFSSSF